MNKKTKIEMIVGTLTILGVISAILFGGYQAYYMRKEFTLLRKDFILRTRPLIKIDFPGYIERVTSSTFMGFKVKIDRENFFLYFDFEENESARLMMPLAFENVGTSPAVMKKLTVHLRNFDDSKYFKHTWDYEELNIQHIIFPHEDVSYDIDITMTAEDYSSQEDPVATFDRVCQAVEELIKAEEFYCVITLRYDHFDTDLGDKLYVARKALRVEPGGKKASEFYHDIR